MKKGFIIFFIMAASIFMNVYGETGIPAEKFNALSYDFEDYGGGYPQGWVNAGNSARLEPVHEDPDYGISMLVNTGAAMYYKMDETITSGKMAIGFDIKPMDTEQWFRIHFRSVTDDYDGHSIFAMTKDGDVCSADTGHAWKFTKFAEYNPGEWLHVDLLIDLDEYIVNYYLDGVYSKSEKAKFADVGGIYFRTESGTAGSKLVLDNIRIGSVREAKITSEYGTSLVPYSEDELKLRFDSGFNPASLPKIKVYELGNNPVEMNPREIQCAVHPYSTNVCDLYFPDGLSRASYYRIDTSEVEMVFGDQFSTKEVFFATSGATGFKNIVKADFSTISFNEPFAPVNPMNDQEWIKGGTTRVFPVYTKDIYEGKDVAVVRFQANNGTASYKDAYCTLTRELCSPIYGNAAITFRMKIINGNQSLSIYDEEGSKTELICARDGYIYFEGIEGSEKIAPISEKWFTIKLKLDFERRTADVLYDDELLMSGRPFAGADNLAQLEFAQKNCVESYENSAFDSSMRADSYIASCEVGQLGNVTSVTSVLFENKNKEQQSALGGVSPSCTRILIAFSAAVKEEMLKDAVKLYNPVSGEIIELNGSYDPSANLYVADVPNYLSGGESYVLHISGQLLDSGGAEISEVKGSFNVNKGILKVESLNVKQLGSVANTEALIEHTDNEEKTVYIITAGYRDDEMIYFDYVPYSLSKTDRKVKITCNFENVNSSDVFRCFLWEDFSTQVPMIHYVDVE